MTPRERPSAPDPATGSARRPAGSAIQSSWDLARAPALAGMAVAVFVAMLALAWFGSGVLLVLFAGLLVSLALDGLVRALGHLPPRWLRLFAVLVALGGLGYGAGLQGARLDRQASEAGTAIARQSGLLRDWLGQRGIAIGEIEAAPRPSGTIGNAGASSFVVPAYLAGAGPAIERVAALIADLVGAFGPVLVVVLLGLAVALDPRAYREGIVRLIPPRQRWRVAQVLDRSGEALRGWLLGRLAAMLATGLGTFAGLDYLGAGAPLVLGLQAGLLAFVPVIGPIVAGLVIVLASSGAPAALGALAVFGAVHLGVSLVLAPLLRRRVPGIPPATILAGQVALGMLLGLPGLVLAVPLMIVGRVLLERVVADREAQAQARDA